MAGAGTVVCVFSLIVACLATEVLDAIPKDTTKCEDSCEQSATEKLKEGNELTSCERGCRFYKIAQHIASSRKDDGSGVPSLEVPRGPESESVDASPPMTICHNSCVSAYNETSPATQSCKMGCAFQKAADASKDSEVMGEPSGHILIPLMQVRQITSRVTGIFHIIKSSLVTFFVSDNQELVAVESDPEMLVEIRPEQLEGEGSHPALARMGNTMSEEGPEVRPTMVQSFSEQLGIPPYLLLISVLALLLFMLYVLVGLCSITPKSKKINVPVAPMAPFKLVRTEDLTKLTLTEEDDSQAPPLPVKVKLPDSEI